MQDILQEIVAHKRIEVERFKAELSEQEIHRRVEPLLDFSVASMSQALTVSDSGIIAEFKRRSPSKGWIKEEGRADIIPFSYQQNGAAALSILTDEKYFGGSDDFIKTARHAGVQIPILYKNFVIDEYQLFQARLCGASAVLLIAADLSKQECKALLGTAHELGLEVLLEMHSEPELEYLQTAVVNWHRLQPVILDGTQYRLVSPYQGNHVALNYVSPDQSQAVLFAYDVYTRYKEVLHNVCLQGLNPCAQYLVTEINLMPGVQSTLPEHGQTYSGDYLMKVGLHAFTQQQLQSRVIELTRQ